MINRFILLFLCLAGVPCIAQVSELAKYSLSGTVVQENNTAVADAIVQLFNASDSALVKTEFTDVKGNYEITGISRGQYFIHVSYENNEKYFGTPFQVTENTTLETPKLSKQNIELKEVTVSVRKPFIEREQGKVILNVENSISASGSSVFEVIEKAPGINITSNDDIIFKGKGGVQVQIDGKLTPMKGSDLANYLRGLSANSVEKIEFIANPSSRYDAAGTSIINIKLKKDKRFGTNGVVTGMFGHGVYPKAGGGISLTHRDKKVSVFGNYNYTYRKGFNDLRLQRRFYRNDSMIGAYDQKNYLIFPFYNQVARVGADYFINSKNTIGIVLNGVNNNFNPTGENTSDVINKNGDVVSRFGTSNRSQDKWYNYSGNVNFKHVTDSTGGEITTDLDYAHYGHNTQQNFTTRYFDLAGSEYTDPYILHGDLNGSLDIYAIKADYMKPLKSDGKLEAGIKSSYVIADNNLIFYNRSGGQNTFDTTKSNHFIYKENINAGYISLSKGYKKWNFQAGLRCEQTRISGEQKIYNVKNDTSYIQLFPNAFAGYKENEKNGFEFSYSRRITRPGYDQLNPFKYYLDPTTYKAGNPYLKPQTTHSWEFSHVFLQKIYSTLSYARTTNNITEVIAPSEKQLTLTVQTNKNLTTVEVYAFNFSVPVEIFKWWYTQNDAGIYYSLYTGNIANTAISRRGNLNYNINSTNTFNISKMISAELTANYRSQEIYAYENVNPIYFLTCGFQFKFRDNKGNIKLNASDVFYTNKIRALAQFNGYQENFLVQRETRVVSATLTYKFGNSNVSARRRNGGAEDVKQRAGATG